MMTSVRTTPPARPPSAAKPSPAAASVQSPGQAEEPPFLDDAAAAQTVASYVAQAAAVTGESARSRLLAGLLQELFGIEAAYLEECEPQAEAFVRVRHKDRAVLGRQPGQPGQFYGNVIIDMEDDLGRAGRGDEARLQLRRYLSCLWTQEPAGKRRRYLCLATDGLRFDLYSPRAPEPGRPAIVPGELRLKRLDMVDAQDPAAAAGLRDWLDRFLCRRKVLAPSRAALLDDFGLESHAFHVASVELADLWSWLSARPECAASFEAWQRAQGLAHGQAAATADTFIRHTYLALIARLAAWARVSGGAGVPDMATARAVLQGRAFRERGIAGLLDEPFFPWLLRPECVDAPAGLALGLAGLLAGYDLDESAAGGLAALYTQIAGPGRPSAESTPAWLAASTVDHLLDGRPGATLLDPACGAGAFLCAAIRRKRAALGDSPETVAHLQDGVAGIDADPLAVTVAQAAWLLSLGSLLGHRGPALNVPVYQADALCGPTPEALPGRPTSYVLSVDGQTVHLPTILAADPRRCYDGAEAAWAFAANWQGSATESDFAAYLWPARPDLAADPEVRAALFALSEDLRRTDLADRGARGLHALQSAYGPLMLRGRFDALVSAPPRLTLGDLPDTEYVGALRALVTRTYRMAPQNQETLGRMELAPLFLVHAANLYLRPGGILAAVLPRGVMNASAHDALRRGSFRGAPMRWTGLWDLEGVTPLFRRPCCVLFGEVGGTAAAEEGMPGLVVSGELAHREADAGEAAGLRRQPVRYYLSPQAHHAVWTTTWATQASLGF